MPSALVYWGTIFIVVVLYTSTRAFYPITNLSSWKKKSGVKQGIKSDWRLVILTMVVEIGFCLDIWLLLLVYISGRTEKISGALFEKECARWRKILSGQMHPWVLASFGHREWLNLTKMSKNSGFLKHGHIQELFRAPTKKLGAYILRVSVCL